MMTKLSDNLASQIESELFANQGDSITKDYGKKFRDLTTGLRHELNKHIRQELLHGELQPVDFVKYDRTQLMPKQLVEKRE